MIFNTYWPFAFLINESQRSEYPNDSISKSIELCELCFAVKKSAIIAHHFHKYNALLFFENGGVPVLPIKLDMLFYWTARNIFMCMHEWKMGTTLKEYLFTVISGNLFYSVLTSSWDTNISGPPTDNHTCSGSEHTCAILRIGVNSIFCN